MTQFYCLIGFIIVTTALAAYASSDPEAFITAMFMPFQAPDP